MNPLIGAISKWKYLLLLKRWWIKYVLNINVYNFQFLLWFLNESHLCIYTAGKQLAKLSELSTLNPLKTTILIID